MKFIFGFTALTLILSGPLLAASEVSIPPHDVVLRVTPIKVKKLEPGVVFDAIEHNYETQKPEAAVLFSIERVLIGKFTILKTKGPSKMEQLSEAAEKREILKILTLDIQEEITEEPKKWIQVAVHDPRQSFGIEDWDNPPSNVYKLYLKRIDGREDSYILVGSKKIEK